MGFVTTAVGFTLLIVAITQTVKLFYMRCGKFMGMPGMTSRALPIVGHFWLYLLLEGVREKGNQFVVFWIGILPFVSITHPEAAEIILKSNVLIEKPDTYEKTLRFVGDGLVLSKSEKWFHRRRLLTPSFHFKILDDFRHVMNEQADIFVSNLAKLKDHSKVDIINAITLCTLDIICETAMGIQIKAQDNAQHYYVKALTRFGEVNRMKLKYPWYNIDTIFRYSKLGREAEQLTATMQSFTRGIIEQRVEDYKKNDIVIKDKKMAFLDMLMNARTENGKPLTEKDLQEEVDTFMFAGHDTNATALTWTLYLLGQHPEVQAKLQQEIDEVFPAHEPFEVTSTHISKLQYMEMVIKESLRLFPPVAMILRKLTQDTVVDGYNIPVNTVCSVMIFAMHRNPDVWDEPEEFKPESFDKNNSVKRHPFAFVPFSAGPRNCIGQRFAMYEQKVILSKFLREFNVVTHVKEKDLYRPYNSTHKLDLRPH